MVNKDNDPALEPALRDVESIQSLDTARLALRWALERMRALERRVSDVETDAKGSESARAKVAAELEAARELLTRRTAEALERERYYAKIEEYLGLKLEGGLDAAALARREARLDERDAELQRRELETEARVKDAARRHDEELKRSLAEASAGADARVREAREEFDARIAAREREQSSRLISLHEKEAQLSALERSLEERRRRFEEFFAAQRAALEREARAIAQAAADQAGFVTERIEQATAAKSKTLESAWRADQKVLMEELASWRAKAREHIPELLEAQHEAARLRDEAARRQEENRLLLEAKTALTEELLRWRAQAQSDLPALLATARRAVESEEAAKQLEVELAAAQRRAEEHLAEIMSREMTEDIRRRELSRLESSLAAKLRDAETDLFRQYDAWLEREAQLRRRDQDWRQEASARRESIEALRSEILAQREELKLAIAAYRAKAETLGAARGTGEIR